MNLKHIISDFVWENVSTRDLVRETLNNNPGEMRLDDVPDKIHMLLTIIEQLIDTRPLTDKEVVRILGVRDWEINDRV